MYCIIICPFDLCLQTSCSTYFRESIALYATRPHCASFHQTQCCRSTFVVVRQWSLTWRNPSGNTAVHWYACTSRSNKPNFARNTCCLFFIIVCIAGVYCETRCHFPCDVVQLFLTSSGSECTTWPRSTIRPLLVPRAHVQPLKSSAFFQKPTF